MSDNKSQIVKASDYGSFSGVGLENFTASDVTTPFLYLLGAKSPQCEVGNPKYVEGATAGMLMNGASQELYPAFVRAGAPLPQGLIFQPVVMKHEYEERTPKIGDQQGNHLGNHDAADALVLDAIADFRQRTGKKFSPRYPLGNGNEINETYLLIGFIHSTEDIAAQTALGVGTPIAITFSSTRIKPLKDYIYQVFSIGTDPTKAPPLFAHRLRLRTVLESRTLNGKPITSHNYVIKPLIEGNVLKSLIPLNDESGNTHPLIAAGRDLNAAFSAGSVKVGVADTKHDDEVSTKPPF
jgi:hypothetical protein